MEKDKFQELFEAKSQAEQQLEKMRTPVAILFSDIKGSTAYYEKKGDIAGMAMIQRHNDLLFPAIQQNGGRVVKTIGDSIMACFEDPVAAVRAGVAMQRVLDHDRVDREDEEQIHIKIGIHHGLGLVKDNDIFGDVVNATARILNQAKADQILITDVLLEAARSGGFQCASFGKADMRGKDEPIDLYAVAWSESATEQLIADIQLRYEARVREAKRIHEELEEEFDRARDQWRTERRKLASEVDTLEEAVEHARHSTHEKLASEMQSEIQFQLDESIRLKTTLQVEFEAAQAKWNEERTSLTQQVTDMQKTMLAAMEKSNNPSRMAAEIREQVESRMASAKQEWSLQWEGERRRLLNDVERLRKAADLDERKEAARRAVLEKLGKLPASPGGAPPKTAGQWQKDFEDARSLWENEREQLTLKIERLETEIQHTTDAMRGEIFTEMQGQYELKLAEANIHRKQLEEQVKSISMQLDQDRRRLSERITELEKAIPDGQLAVRRQIVAQLESETNAKLDENNRLRSRAERKLADLAEELDSEQRRSRRLISQLEEQLKEAREAAYRAQRMRGVGSGPES